VTPETPLRPSAVELREAFVLQVGLEQWLLPRASCAPGDVERSRALLRDRLGDRARVAPQHGT
jgi:hypothetical protein